MKPHPFAVVLKPQLLLGLYASQLPVRLTVIIECCFNQKPWQLYTTLQHTACDTVLLLLLLLLLLLQTLRCRRSSPAASEPAMLLAYSCTIRTGASYRSSMRHAVIRAAVPPLAFLSLS
jgi:hypothetical protein